MLRRDRQLLTQIHQLKDAALFAVALWIAHQFRAVWFYDWFPKGEIEPFQEFAWLYLLIIPGAPIILEILGYYQRPLLAPRPQTIWMLLKGCSLITLAVILVMFFFKLALARAVILLFWPISFALLYANDELLRWFYRSRFAQMQLKKRVVLVGTPPDTARMKMELSGLEAAIDFVGELDINDTGVKELVALLHKTSPSSVVINAKHTYFGQVEKAILACEREGIEAWLVADFFKTQISRTTLDDLHGRPVLVFRSAPEISCRACIAACPFGVISYNANTGRVNKCTLCDDRIHNGLETACAKACPTDSIVYGEVEELRAAAKQRVETLKSLGHAKANLYGDTDILGGLNVFYLLLDEPEVYGQPVNPQLPQKNLLSGSLFSIGSAVLLGLSAIVAFRNRGQKANSQNGKGM